MSKPVKQCLVIFGASGHLACSKLLPSLFLLIARKEWKQDCRLLLLARRQANKTDFLASIQGQLQAHIDPCFDNEENWGDFYRHIDFLRLDIHQAEGMDQLGQKLKAYDQSIFYLAIASELFSPLCRALARAGIFDEHCRVVVEKPLGHDEASAEQINGLLAGFLEEGQIFRIDHYLAKESVQNLLALRFANLLFEPLWNEQYIRQVQISMLECDGIGPRGAYYDQAGALRDMVQNHLMQLLCLCCMEAPDDFSGQAMHEQKLKVLQNLQPLDLARLAENCVRGQYQSKHSSPCAYRNEQHVAANSDTETYVALALQLDTPRWQGVPFFLRTGKALDRQQASICVEFKDLTQGPFAAQSLSRNYLLISLQPEARIELCLQAKHPGRGMQLEPISLELTGGEIERHWSAYERLLIDIVEDDHSLFMRRSEIKAAWRWIDPIIQAWQGSADACHPYEIGSEGPDEAKLLLRARGFDWF